MANIDQAEYENQLARLRQIFTDIVEHVELETVSDFFEIFVEACQFKPLCVPSAPLVP